MLSLSPGCSTIRHDIKIDAGIVSPVTRPHSMVQGLHNTVYCRAVQIYRLLDDVHKSEDPQGRPSTHSRFDREISSQTCHWKNIKTKKYTLTQTIRCTCPKLLVQLRCLHRSSTSGIGLMCEKQIQRQRHRSIFACQNQGLLLAAVAGVRAVWIL